jgi:hypothetical protein
LACEALARSLVVWADRAMHYARIVIKFREPRLAPRAMSGACRTSHPSALTGVMTAKEAQHADRASLGRIDDDGFVE